MTRLDPCSAVANFVLSAPVANLTAAADLPAATAVFTNAVVANCVLLTVATAVGAVGVPLKPGETKLDFAFNAVCVAVDTGLFTSDVLSTLLKPKEALVGRFTLIVPSARTVTPVPIFTPPSAEAVAAVSVKVSPGAPSLIQVEPS
ncbi:hypothetical protein FACS189474_0600 [Bacteroidia bacterium]|nr:hypothetical protein FACS189474_0600 [Bacteroidia bacterium]